jgi:hypothetical protein
MTFTPNQITTDQKTYCAVHPTVETTLRCNKCGRYMCTRCAVRTPVGYRCKECVHQQQDVFFSATQRDYLIAAGVSFALSIPISYIIPRIFLLGVLILSIPAGALITEVVHRAVGRRRGRYTWIVVAGGIIAGALVATFPLLREIFYVIGLTSQRVDPSVPSDVVNQARIGAFAQLLSPILYVVLCVGAAIARLRYGGN